RRSHRPIFDVCQHSVTLDVINEERRSQARCTTVNMVRDGPGLIGESPAHQAGTPGKVQVLVVQEEPLIEVTDLRNEPAPEQHAGTTGTKDFGRLSKPGTISLAQASIASTAVLIEFNSRAVDHTGT